MAEMTTEHRLVVDLDGRQYVGDDPPPMERNHFREDGGGFRVLGRHVDHLIR